MRPSSCARTQGHHGALWGAGLGMTGFVAMKGRYNRDSAWHTELVCGTSFTDHAPVTVDTDVCAHVSPAWHHPPRMSSPPMRPVAGGWCGRLYQMLPQGIWTRPGRWVEACHTLHGTAGGLCVLALGSRLCGGQGSPGPKARLTLLPSHTSDSDFKPGARGG